MYTKKDLVMFFYVRIYILCNVKVDFQEFISALTIFTTMEQKERKYKCNKTSQTPYIHPLKVPLLS